jgi:hypothetical protein
VGVDDSTDVGTSPIDEQVHGNLAGNIALPHDFMTKGIDDHEILGSHHTFAHKGRSAKKVGVAQTDRQVTVGRSHQARLVE